ncbi:MAG: HAD family phosphatase [Paracoccaceae bacterium]
MKPFAAAIFDLDGLLIDTEQVSLDAGYEAMQVLGWPRRDGLLESLIGRDPAAAALIVHEAYQHHPTVGDFEQLWRQYYRKRIEGGIALCAGVTELLAHLAGMEMPLGVATSSTQVGAELKLRIAGLSHHFHTVVTVDCVARPKPAPDPYLEAARRLKVAPADCIAFDDSDPGTAAARAAGMTVVQVPNLGQSSGGCAHHLATDLLTGARMAGLI